MQGSSMFCLIGQPIVPVKNKSKKYASCILATVDTACLHWVPDHRRQKFPSLQGQAATIKADPTSKFGHNRVSGHLLAGWVEELRCKDKLQCSMQKSVEPIFKKSTRPCGRMWFSQNLLHVQQINMCIYHTHYIEQTITSWFQYTSVHLSLSLTIKTI